MLRPATPWRRTLRSARHIPQRSVSVIEASAANAVSKMPTDSPCSLAQRGPAPPPRRRRGAPRPPRCARWTDRTGRRRRACAWRRRRSGRWTRRRAAGPVLRGGIGPGRGCGEHRQAGQEGQEDGRLCAEAQDRSTSAASPHRHLPRSATHDRVPQRPPHNGGHSGDATGGAQRATRRCDRDVIVRGCRAPRATPRPPTRPGPAGRRAGSAVAGSAVVWPVVVDLASIPGGAARVILAAVDHAGWT